MESFSVVKVAMEILHAWGEELSFLYYNLTQSRKRMIHFLYSIYHLCLVFARDYSNWRKNSLKRMQYGELAKTKGSIKKPAGVLRLHWIYRSIGGEQTY